ncbi:MAG: NAD-dependent epimerase/dehydratase family protein [Chitinivibrionales bacterium]|nr:NAD-dependent epimerase/dehydratase family protein [Chitinivibrionales bacterium]
MTRKKAKLSKILVIGGAGYIGSRLIRDLSDNERFKTSDILIYDNLRNENYCGLMGLPEYGNFQFIEGDILDRVNLSRAMQNVDVVIHLAAIARAPLSFDRPELTRATNHWGTASVAECALDCGVSHLIYTSSASVYGPGGPFSEEDACRPIGPYSISKLQGENEVLNCTKRGLNATIIRLGTVFGYAPAMRYDAVISRFAYLAGVNRPIVIHGSGKQVRPFIHINDASDAIMLVMSNLTEETDIYNVATMNVSVNEITEAIKAIVPDVGVHYTDQDMLTEVSFEVLAQNISELGFEPKYKLEGGLREIMAHWRGFKKSTKNTIVDSGRD